MPRDLQYFEPYEWEMLAVQELDNRRRTHAVQKSRLSEMDGARLAALSAYYSDLSPGVLTGAALAGFEPTDPQMYALGLDQAERDMEVWQEERGQQQLAPDNWIKKAARSAMLGFDFLWEEGLQRPLRALVGTHQGMTWDQAYEAAAPSMLGLLAREARAGRPVNIGTGFFPGGELAPETERLLQLGVPMLDAIDNEEQRALGKPIFQTQDALRKQITIAAGPGSNKRIAVTPGRLISTQFVEEDEDSFNLLSGALDLGANIFLDPSNLLFWGAKSAKIAGRTLVGNGARKGFLSRTWDEYLSSKTGRELAGWIAEQGPDQYQTLHGFFKASNHTPPAGVVKELTDLSDPFEVTAALSKYGNTGALGSRTLTPTSVSGRLLGAEGGFINRGLGGLAGAAGQTPAFLRSGDFASTIGQASQAGAIGGFKVGFRAGKEGTYLGKMTALVGARNLDLADLDQAVDDFGQWLIVAGLDKSRVSHHMHQLAATQKIGPGGLEGVQSTAAFEVVTSAVKEWGTVLKQGGISDPIVQKFTEMFHDIDDYRKYFINQSGNPEWFPGVRTTISKETGEAIVLPSAQLFSEFIDRAIPLIDVGKTRKALRMADVGKLRDKTGKLLGRGVEDWEDIGPGVMTILADNYMNRIWKPFVLLRFAWPVRVVGEEQIRMAAAGMDSAFRHPIHYLAWATGRKGDKTVLGDAFETAHEFRAAQSRAKGASGFIDHRGNPRKIGSSEFILQEKGRHSRYWEGYWYEVNKLSSDELVPLVAQAEGPEGLAGIKAAFYEGDLKHLRHKLMNDGDRWHELSYQAQADGYIDSLNARLHKVAGGDYIYFRASSDLIDKEWVGKLTPEAKKMLAEQEGLWFNSSGQVVDPLTVPLADGTRRVKKPDVTTQLQTGAFHEPKEPLSVRFEFLEAAAADDLENLDVLGDMWNTRQAALMLRSSLPVQPEFGDDLDRAFGRLDALLDDIEGNPNSFDPQDMDEAMTGLFDAVEAKHPDLPMPAEGYAIEDLIKEINAQPQREYIPFLEAARLHQIRPAEMSQAVHGFENMDHMIPQSIPDGWNLTDGVYGLPEGVDHVFGAGGYGRVAATGPVAAGEKADVFIAVHNGKVHGVLTISRKSDGTVLGVPYLATSGATAEGGRAMFPTDVRDLFAAALDNPGVNADDLLGLLMGGTTGPGGTNLRVKDWLQAGAMQAAGIDTSALTTVEEVIDAIRKSGIPDVWERMNKYAPGGVEIMSREGAAAAQAGVRRHTTRPRIETWKQHRPQYEITRPGDPRIIEAIATGKLTSGGKELDLLGAQTKRQISDIIGAFKDDFGDVTPQFSYVAKKDDPTMWSQWDKAIDQAFNIFMSVPTNKLSRSPAFKQFYWKRMAQLFDYSNAEVKEQILHAAADAGIGRPTMASWLKGAFDPSDPTLRELDKLAGPGFKLKGVIVDPLEGIDSVGRADDIAKAFALHETKTLLYDLSRKHNFFDITRNIFPFGEAWYEIISTWARLLGENPAVMRRLQQGVMGARRSGFFYNDPQTGEEMFNFPGSDLIARWMFSEDRSDLPVAGGAAAGVVAGGALGSIGGPVGTAVGGAIGGALGTFGGILGAGAMSEEEPIVTPQFAGRVSGVNIALGGFIPGVGPLVQIPVSNFGWLDDPDRQWAKDLLLPFGSAKVESLGDAAEAMIAPTWWDKFMVAMGKPSGDNQRLYMNTVTDVYRSLIMTGKGSDKTPEEAAATFEEAKRLGRTIYRIRAASQFIGPTGAQVRFDARDKEGQVWAFQSLASVYREMLEKNEFDHFASYNEFIGMYGIDPTLITTPKSRSIVRRSVTPGGDVFERQNPELFTNLPLTAYYARPDSNDEEFDYNAYLRQLDEGTREALTTEEWAQERNDFLGRLAYERARRTVVDNDSEAADIWLRQYRVALRDRFPGYDVEIPGLDARPTRDQLIDEFYKWREYPGLMETRAGAGLMDYLSLRDRVVGEGIRLGLTPTGFRTAKRAAYLRDWLRLVAQSIIKRYPDFGPMWEQVFAREIEEREQPMTLMGVSFDG